MSQTSGRPQAQAHLQGKQSIYVNHIVEHVDLIIAVSATKAIGASNAAVAKMVRKIREAMHAPDKTQGKEVQWSGPHSTAAKQAATADLQ